MAKRESGKSYSARWELGEPFTIHAKTEGELCCPRLWKLPCGDLLVAYSDDGDFMFARSKVLRSRDGGSSWQADALDPSSCIANIGNRVTRAYDRYSFVVKGSTPKRYLFQYRDSFDGGRTFGAAQYGSYEHEGEANPRISDCEKYHTLFHNIIRWEHVLTAAGWQKEEWTEVEVGYHGPSYFSNLIESPDGSLLNVFNVQSDGAARTQNYYLHVARSTDGGVHWRHHARINPLEHPPGVRSNASEGYATRLANGGIHVVYRYPPNHRQVLHTWSSDEGKTWTPPRPIDGRVCGIVPAAKLLSDGALFLVHGRPGMFLAFDPSGTAEGWEIDHRWDIANCEDLTIRTNAKVTTARLDLLWYRRYYDVYYSWVRQDLFAGYFYSWENINGEEILPGKILLVYDLQNCIEHPGADPKKAVRGLWVTRS